MNFKSLTLGAFIAMAAVGLTACGEDSKTPTTPNFTSSSSMGEVVSSIAVLENAPIIFESVAMGASNGAMIKFNGVAKIDYYDTTQALIKNTMFIDVALDVVQLDAAGEMHQTTAKVIYTPTVPASTISLAEMGAYVDLTDPAFVQCGDNFLLRFIVTASDGQNPSYQQVAYAAFSRPAETYCKDPNQPVSSSSVEAGLPMTKCEIEVSTKSKYAVDIDACVAYGAADMAAHVSEVDLFYYKADDEVVIWSPTTAATKDTKFSAFAAGQDTKFGSYTGDLDVKEGLPEPVTTSMFNFKFTNRPNMTDVYGSIVLGTKSDPANLADAFIFGMFTQKQVEKDFEGVMVVYKVAQ
ncbi:MAG: hypothetical protein HUK21_06020 [Fibrobacteraceae bacterium]|nr:hypothetical protein [Fibrobacteraceae bacterium]